MAKNIRFFFMGWHLGLFMNLKSFKTQFDFMAISTY